MALTRVVRITDLQSVSLDHDVSTCHYYVTHYNVNNHGMTPLTTWSVAS